MHSIRTSTRLAALLMVLAYPPPAARAGNPNPTDFDWAIVPTWCPAAGNAAQTAGTIEQIKDPLIRAKLFGLNKSGCGGYHHYCYALIWGNRGFLYDGDRPELRSSYFTNALDDYQYVLNQSRTGCSLFPDIYTKIGEIKAQLGNRKEAEHAYITALKTRHGYVPAMLGLADLYESYGDTLQALDLLREGVKGNPESSALKTKLQRLEARTPGHAQRP